jgi:death-on-curing protein
MMKYLSTEFVLAAHSRVIDLYGGLHGVRDPGLLDSALAQPQASFAGQELHPDVWTKAAAYAYHICRNHPFLDGNKRIAAVAMGAFLGINGHDVEFDEVELYLTMTDLAAGQLTKDTLAEWLLTHARPGR